MANKYELSEAVLRVIGQSSKMIGGFHDDDSNQRIWRNCLDWGMESPIEQILYAAFEAIREINGQESAEPEPIDGKDYIIGLGLIPQYKCGRYRADFLGVFGRKSYKGNVHRNEVIVECDSQQFHERTEAERRYEKARDRFFQVKGYKVFRFTGKEILEDPFKVACEVVGFLTEQDPVQLYEYAMEYK